MWAVESARDRGRDCVAVGTTTWRVSFHSGTQQMNHSRMALSVVTSRPPRYLCLLPRRRPVAASGSHDAHQLWHTAETGGLADRHPTAACATPAAKKSRVWRHPGGGVPPDHPPPHGAYGQGGAHHGAADMAMSLPAAESGGATQLRQWQLGSWATALAAATPVAVAHARRLVCTHGRRTRAGSPARAGPMHPAMRAKIGAMTARSTVRSDTAAGSSGRSRPANGRLAARLAQGRGPADRHSQ